MGEPNLFEILGMLPAPNLAAVKLAYYAALARHPPHTDPEGFRRIRTAYEALQEPGALAAAYLGSPVDAAAFLAGYASWDALIQDAHVRRQQQRARDAAGETFIAAYSALPLDQALSAATSPAPH